HHPEIHGGVRAARFTAARCASGGSGRAIARGERDSLHGRRGGVKRRRGGPPAAAREQRLAVTQLGGVLFVKHALEYSILAFVQIPQAAVVPVVLVVPIHPIDDGKQAHSLQRYARVVCVPELGGDFP